MIDKEKLEQLSKDDLIELVQSRVFDIEYKKKDILILSYPFHINAEARMNIKLSFKNIYDIDAIILEEGLKIEGIIRK